MKQLIDNRFRRGVFILLIFSFFVSSFALSQYVPSVSSFSSTISTSRPEKGATHTVQFNANGTIPPGGQIDILFGDNFTIHENMSYQELSFFVNDSKKELSSAAGTDVCGGLVETGSGGRVSINLADNLTIEDGDSVRIEIGEGTRTIENPSTSGTYKVHAEVFDSQGELINRAVTLIAIIEAVDVATAETPQVITGEAEVLGREEAILKGELFDLAGIGEADLFFEYRIKGVEEGDIEDHPDHTQEEGDWIETEKFGRSEVVTYDQQITGLNPGTYYDYRAVMEWTNSPTSRLSGLIKDFLTDRVDEDPPEDEDEDDEGDPGAEPPEEGDPGEGEDEPGDPDPPPPGSNRDDPGEPAAPPPPELQDPPPYIVFSGWAYPDSGLALFMEGEEVQTTEANQSGGFSLEINEPHSGTYDFTVVQRDDLDRPAEEISTRLEVDPEKVTAVLDNVFPPTIELSQSQIASGDSVTLSGLAAPDGEVEIRFRGSDEEFTRTAEPESDGSWSLNLDYEDLEEGSYNVQARLNIFDERSLYGDSKNLSVGETGCVAADANSDGEVNLTDFSILMHHWGTSAAEGDINGDGTVDLVDFSIMMDCWTG